MAILGKFTEFQLIKVKTTFVQIADGLIEIKDIRGHFKALHITGSDKAKWQDIEAELDKLDNVGAVNVDTKDKTITDKIKAKFKDAIVRDLNALPSDDNAGRSRGHNPRK